MKARRLCEHTDLKDEMNSEISVTEECWRENEGLRYRLYRRKVPSSAIAGWLVQIRYATVRNSPN